MPQFLRGNYKIDKEIEASEASQKSALEAEFERKALSRLGGSICFVSKKGFVWTGDAEPATRAAAPPQEPPPPPASA
jgi:hypothetical protein